jgi:hypothetical protein
VHAHIYRVVLKASFEIHSLGTDHHETARNWQDVFKTTFGCLKNILPITCGLSDILKHHVLKHLQMFKGPTTSLAPALMPDDIETCQQASPRGESRGCHQNRQNYQDV